MTTAFDPIDLGGRPLANRIVMAPMTRSRAYGPGATPTPAMATYYAQRATAGLIVTEGAQPSATGQGYPDTPGLHSPEQVEAWKPVTDAVHRRGGTVYAQLMHTGRIGHPSLRPDGLPPLAPSPVAAPGTLHTHAGPQTFPVPREMTDSQIRETVQDFASAARNAIAAGFDGVEIHGANGYLVHQFLADNTNLRTDGWGGPGTARIRFAVEVAAAVASAVGAHRVGIRLSPGNTFNDIAEAAPHDVYPALTARLGTLGLAYLHLVEGEDPELTRELRKDWPGTFVLNPHTGSAPTGPEALSLIEDGAADMISYGALFIANPDLPARFAAGGPYNTPDRTTFYGGTERGYTDYPRLGT
ncbi:alkene reductase [Streptomyces sp. NPDC002454]|uniref:alkene reductase n=1 Tax=Streptomyces sp. NPDC002490 TaxID=3154416 RepID=UPI0033265074